MKRTKFFLAVALALAVVPTAPALGKSIARNVNPVQQALQADVVVVGKVVEMERDIVEATPFQGSPQKSPYLIANVKVAENLAGANGLTQIRVGFVPNGNGSIYNEEFQFQGRAVRGYIGGYGNQSLTSDSEGCFFLKKHHEGDFYIQVQYGMRLDKKADNFDDELKKVRRMMQITEKPLDSLKAKEAADRQFAACVLTTKYRTYPQMTGGQTLKMANIPAEESKLIMQALASMDWGQTDENGLALQNVWYMINPQQKDGWVQPVAKPNEDFNAAMTDAVQKWLKANTEKFVIQRYVVEKPKK